MIILQSIIQRSIRKIANDKFCFMSASSITSLIKHGINMIGTQTTLNRKMKEKLKNERIQQVKSLNILVNK